MFLFTFSDFFVLGEKSVFKGRIFMSLVCVDLNLMVILRCEKCGPGYFGQPDIVGMTLSLLLLGDVSALCSYVT